MYLARRFIHGTIQYTIRESFRDGSIFRHRDLLDLGSNPQQFIVYADSRTFVIDNKIAERLEEKGVEADPFELEELFNPFVDPLLRERIDSFADRAKHRRWKPVSTLMRQRVLDETHSFDRRRAHFLRFGQVDQRQLMKAVSIYKPLLDKSRDEIEQSFLFQEMALRPDEYKNYIYAIFNLQAFFTQSFAHSMPEALDTDKMDTHFIDQICAIHDDEVFWDGFEKGESLHEYLVRYVVMYFDYSFATGTGWNEYILDFMDSRRRFTPPKSSKRMSMGEAATVFGVSRGELAEMGQKELKRLFRKKAREHHPDKGGEHESFVELAAAYHELSRIKRRKG